jgi:hypothetical protein
MNIKDKDNKTEINSVCRPTGVKRGSKKPGNTDVPWSGVPNIVLIIQDGVGVKENIRC